MKQLKKTKRLFRSKTYIVLIQPKWPVDTFKPLDKYYHNPMRDQDKALYYAAVYDSNVRAVQHALRHQKG